jgi:hypothetical protein
MPRKKEILMKVYMTVELSEMRASMVSNFADIPGLKRRFEYPHYPGHALVLAKLDSRASLSMMKLYHPREMRPDEPCFEWEMVRDPLWYVPREWPPFSLDGDSGKRKEVPSFILPSLWPSGTLVKVISAVEEELLVRGLINEITMKGSLKSTFITI